MLREADHEDVLHRVDTSTLDRIAHRIYADEPEYLSAYERLHKDDKRQKMDYLKRTAEPTQPNLAASDEYVQHLRRLKEER